MYCWSAISSVSPARLLKLTCRPTTTRPLQQFASCLVVYSPISGFIGWMYTKGGFHVTKDKSSLLLKGPTTGPVASLVQSLEVGCPEYGLPMQDCWSTRRVGDTRSQICYMRQMCIRCWTMWPHTAPTWLKARLRPLPAALRSSPPACKRSQSCSQVRHPSKAHGCSPDRLNKASALKAALL